MLLMERRKLLRYFRHTDWKIPPKSTCPATSLSAQQTSLRHNVMHKHSNSSTWFYSFTHPLQYPNQKGNVDCSMRFDFIVVVTVRMANMQDVTSCSLVDMYCSFGKICCRHREASV